MIHPPRHILFTLAIIASISASWSGYTLYRTAHPPERDAPPAIRSDTEMDLFDHYEIPKENVITDKDTGDARDMPLITIQSDTPTIDILPAEGKITPTASTPPPSGTPPDQPPDTQTTQTLSGNTLTIHVGTDTYVIPHTTGITAEQAMDLAVTHYEGSFSYQGTSYGSALGTFVHEINGIAQDSRQRMYWILYHNGAASHKGISTLILEPFDIITWKYEKEKL